MKGRSLLIIILGIIILGVIGRGAGTAQAAIIDTYYEDFDDRQDDATIHGVDGTWSVDQGETSYAITQDSTAYEGTGNALELRGAETTVSVSDTRSFDEVSPTWMEFIIKPGMGAQTRSVPTGKIAAITFDHTGKVYASNGSSWVDTEETFTSDNWYRVILKIDFSTHKYDIYIFSVTEADVEFIPDKENLTFIDTSIDSISQIGFGGAYNADETGDDSFIDNLIIHFIERLTIITAAQTITEDLPSGPIAVQLQNAYYEPQTTWEDITLELRSTSDSGQFSLDDDTWVSINQVIVPEGSQQATFYYKDGKAGAPIITVNKYVDRGWEEALQQQEIVSEVAHFDISVTTPQIAGEYFTILITAKDDEGNINESYSGEADIVVDYISPESGTMSIAPELASGFADGLLELSAVYPDCGLVEITVVDRGDFTKTGTSGEILFLPASYGVDCEDTQVVGSEFDLTVTAYNADGGTALNYNRLAVLDIVPVTPEEISGGELTPTVVAAIEFIEGVATRKIEYDRWGIIKIRAHDEDYPAQTGMSTEIEFEPAGLLVEVEAPSGEREFFYIGETVPITISVVDGEGDAIPNYTGLILLNSTVGLSVPAEYRFVEANEGRYAFTSSSDTAGTYIVEVEEEENELTAQSPEIEVKTVTIIVDDTEAPVGTTEVTVSLVDEDGNIVTSENDLTITVELEEENSNSSASFFAEAITFQNGIATFLVSNTEAEFVTISPKSEYGFKIKKGTVRFGRVAKKGIGVLMWRELKD